MIIFFVLLGALCLYRIRFALLPKMKPENGAAYYPDYLSIEKTTSVKGIFILIVLLSHAASYLTLSGGILDKGFSFIMSLISQSMVAPFLFYSGYGVMLSIDRKGSAYVRGIPKNRFLKVLLHFDIAVVVYGIMQLLLGKTFSTLTYLLSLTGWDSLGNSNWYIFIVLCLYLITWLAFTIAKDKKWLGFALTALLSVLLIAALYFTKDSWWYDTVLCYLCGMGYYLCKDRIEAIFASKRILYYAAIGLCGGIWLACIFVLHATVFVLIRHLAFITLLVLLTMRISINNKILQFFGTHLFTLYILQRIPMITLTHFGLNENKYLFVLLSLSITVLLAVPFDLLLKKMDERLFPKKAA